MNITIYENNLLTYYDDGFNVSEWEMHKAGYPDDEPLPFKAIILAIVALWFFAWFIIFLITDFIFRIWNMFRE